MKLAQRSDWHTHLQFQLSVRPVGLCIYTRSVFFFIHNFVHRWVYNDFLLTVVCKLVVYGQKAYHDGHPRVCTLHKFGPSSSGIKSVARPTIQCFLQDLQNRNI